MNEIIKLYSNFDSSMGSIIGTYKGIAGAAVDERFIRQILLNANEKTLEKFNERAAERAKATRNLNSSSITHVFEYGVAGITPGAVKFTDATSPAARLWVFRPIATGTSVNTFTTFRDARVPNPKPSERPDLRKMDPKFVEKMSNKQYIFRRRAELTEDGATVSISPRSAKALIFPSRENESGAGFWRREFGPMSVSLAGESANGTAKRTHNFSKFLLKWWESEGQAKLTQSAHNSFAARVGAVRKQISNTGKVKPVKQTDVAMYVRDSEARAMSIMMRNII